MASELRNRLDKHLKAMCVELGFKKAKYLFYRKNGEWIATVGFGYASYQMKGHIFLSCTIGVSNMQFYSLYLENAGLESNNSPDNMIQTQIGYIMPHGKFLEWDITEQTDIEQLCNEIKVTLVKWAFPFYEKYSDIDDIFMALYDNSYFSTTKPAIWLSIIYYLKGNKAKALECLDKTFLNNKYANVLEKNFDNNFRKLLI